MGASDNAIFLVTGNDEAAIEAEAKALVAGLAGADPEPGALEAFREREDVSAGELVQQTVAALLAPPFLLEHKTVWLHKTSGFVSAEGGKKGAAKAAEAQPLSRLAETVASGLPPGIRLVVSGPGAEKVLGDAVRQAGGKVRLCQKPDPKDRNWQAAMAGLIRSRAKEKGLALEGEAVECLVAALGVDTLRLDGELEKLACHAGGRGTVSAADVLLLCRGEGGEADAFALQEAVGRRSLADVWRELQAALERAKDPEQAVLQLLRGLHNQFRSLLQIRVFLQERRDIRSAEDLKRAAEALSGEARAEALRRGFEFVTFHPFRLQKMHPMALRYSGKELVQAIPLLRDAYQKCVTGGVSSKQVLLEDLMVRLVGGKG